MTTSEKRNLLIPVTDKTILFRGMKGTLLEDDRQDEFIEKVLRMEKDRYAKIYTLEDGRAGSFLFLHRNSNLFELITCGSGTPTERHLYGVLEYIDYP